MAIQSAYDPDADTYGYDDPYGYDQAPAAPAAPGGGLPPYPAPEGQEWVGGPGQWTLQPRDGPGRVGYQPDGPQEGAQRRGGPNGDTIEEYRNGQWVAIGQAGQGAFSAGTVGGGGGGGTGGPPERPSFNFRSAPSPNLPQFSYAPMAAIDKFSAPTGDAVLNEPGYAFREQQGRQALEQSAAGRGTLRTGGTLKDLIAYGQQFASNEYGNVYNRSKGEYDTDVDNKFRTYGTNFGVARDVFDREYRRASDLYAPTLAEWQFNQGAELQSGLSAFDQAWNDYINNKNIVSRGAP